MQWKLERLSSVIHFRLAMESQDLKLWVSYVCQVDGYRAADI